MQYVATGIYADGSAGELTRVAEWTGAPNGRLRFSSDVGEEGLATALTEGIGAVAATFEGLSDTTNIVVLDPDGENPIEKIDIFPPDETIQVGSALQYQAIAYLEDGSAVDITRDAVWLSSDESVATLTSDVSAPGVAIALAPGVVEVTASFSNETGNARLEVSEDGAGELVSIDVRPPDVTLQSLTTQQFEAIGNYADGSTRNITAEVAWQTDDGDVLIVSNSDDFGRGLALGLETGETTIRASRFVGLEPIERTAAVRVIGGEGIPGELIVNPVSARAVVGDTQQYTAQLVLDNGLRDDVTDSVVWTSTDTAVAAVGSTGLAFAERPGNARIVATLQVGDGILEDSGELIVEPGDLTIEQIIVDPIVSQVLVNDTQSYSARARLSDGSTIDVTGAVDWSSSDSGVAQIDQAGNALGISPGVVEIRARFNGRSLSEDLVGTAVLTVKANANVTNLVVSPSSQNTVEGSSVFYTATAILSDGTSVVVTEDASWQVDDSSVAAVVAPGEISGLTAGETTVRATLVVGGDSLTDTATLIVSSDTIIDFAVIPAVASIGVGGGQQFFAQVTLVDGNVIDVTDAVNWTSSEGDIAHVDSSGFATGLSAGVSQIFARGNYEGVEYEASATLSARADISLTGLSVEPVVASVIVEGDQQFRAIARFSDGSSTDVTTQASWTSSAPEIAQVSATGLATGLAVGEADINARYQYMDSSASDAATLTVNNAAITDIVVEPALQTVYTGNQVAYTARLILEDGSSIVVTEQATWTTGDEAIAVAEPNTGIVTGVGPGSTPVVALIEVEGISWIGNAQLEVIPTVVEVTELVVTPLGESILVGGTVQYTATAVYEDGTTEDVTSVSGWASSDTGVAYVDERGLASGSNPGVAQIIASYSAAEAVFTAFGTLTVGGGEVVVTEIVVSPPTSEVLVGGNENFSAAAVLSDGSQRDVTGDVQWVSDSPAVADVDSIGQATGISPGTAGISATLVLSEGSFSDTGFITVKPDDVEILALEVSPPAAEVLEGGSQNFTASVRLSDGSSEDVTTRVAWTSGDPAVAHVDSAGLATGVSEGNTSINASLSYEGQTYADAAAITVLPPAIGIQEIQVSPASAEILEGASQQFEATAILTDGSSRPVTNQVDWTSSNSAVAVVDVTGLAEGLQEGDTQITATLIYQGDPYSGVAGLTVLPQSVEIEELVVEPVTAEVLVGDQQQYTARVILSDGSDRDVTRDVNWSSDNSGIARVSSTGLAIGVAEGDAIIKARLEYNAAVF